MSEDLYQREKDIPPRDDAAAFAEIDELRVKPISRRESDKRTPSGRRRFVRAMGTGFVLRAECGCMLGRYLGGGTCAVCGGAHLTTQESAHT